VRLNYKQGISRDATACAPPRTCVRARLAELTAAELKVRAHNRPGFSLTRPGPRRIVCNYIWSLLRPHGSGVRRPRGGSRRALGPGEATFARLILIGPNTPSVVLLNPEQEESQALRYSSSPVPSSGMRSFGHPKEINLSNEPGLQQNPCTGKRCPRLRWWQRVSSTLLQKRVYVLDEV